LKTALTIAGSDSSGGAGIQADIKTFSALGVFGMSAITAITAQNTCGVLNVWELDEAIVQDQIDAVFNDIPVHAVKIGMLCNAAIVNVVAEALKRHKPSNIVVDPVMVSKNGRPLLQPDAAEKLIELIFPLADVVTPNLPEAARITGLSIEDRKDMEKAARRILALGPKHVVIKGGHLLGQPYDLLFDGQRFIEYRQNRIDTVHTHGTGCTFASAIAASLAQGMTMRAAVDRAKNYVTTAIRHGFALGKGIGPTHHFYELYEKAGLPLEG